MVGHVGPSSRALEILGHQADCLGDSKGPIFRLVRGLKGAQRRAMGTQGPSSSAWGSSGSGQAGVSSAGPSSYPTGAFR